MLLLNILDEGEELGFINIFTGDESWFYIKFNPKGAWILPDKNLSFFENTGFHVRKFMLIIIWEIDGDACPSLSMVHLDNGKVHNSKATQKKSV